jgi:hypothetical protein
VKGGRPLGQIVERGLRHRDLERLEPGRHPSGSSPIRMRRL